MLLSLAFAAVLASSAGLCAAGAPAAETADKPATIVRELFVPFESLDALLENQPRRVLLSRQEYEDLLKKAKTAPESHAPRKAVLISADYTATVLDERARFTGTLVVDLLEDDLVAVPLDLANVGLTRAVLDGKAAAIGRSDDGRLTLFASGTGRHKLLLEMVVQLETTAARQSLGFRLPRPAATQFSLTVPGDVEVTSGAHVVSREVDQSAGVTRFDLLPPEGDTALVMTLNSRLKREDRVVAARSVLVDEVTEAYERLHATVSLGVLHGAVDRFSFRVPDGFDVTDVASPHLARWEIRAEGPTRLLDVRLREQTTDNVVLNISAVKTPPVLDDWTFPKLEPVDVVSQVALVGLLTDRRLKAESIRSESLIPINTAVLRKAMPETIFNAEPGAPPLSPVVAYYAPQESFNLVARFDKPPAETTVVTNVLLTLGDKGHEIRGQFLLTPIVDKLFWFDFSVPAGWHVTGVTAADQNTLTFERYGQEDQAARIRVRLPAAVAPGESYAVGFTARRTPGGWLGTWQQPQQVEFPVLSVAGASRDVGALAVEVLDDLAVRPETLQQLTPLDEAEKAEYGLTGVDATLVYRYENPPYRATLTATRTRPRLTAQTFSFLSVEPEGLKAHYEIAYQVEQARTRELAFLLPADTPADLAIRGLDGVGLKEFAGHEAPGGMRRWNVLLEEPRRGRIRLAVDFRQPLADQQPKDFALPLVTADGVAYQSGLVSVEGNLELDVQVETTARRVDVGELVDADYQPGRGLLGAFGFVGDPPGVTIDVFRRPGYRLDPAIVERLELTTLLSADGVSQTAARFALRAKSLYLEVKLPPTAVLWSADLDGQPIKPQRQGASLLVSLPAAAAGQVPSLKIVYQDSVARLTSAADRVEIAAPKLLLRSDLGGEAIEVPTADLVWHLHLPSGYEVTSSDGTVVAHLTRPEPAALTVARLVGALAFVSPGLPMSSSSSVSMPMAERNGRDYPQTGPDDAYYAADGIAFDDSADMDFEAPREALPPAATTAPSDPTLTLENLDIMPSIESERSVDELETAGRREFGRIAGPAPGAKPPAPPQKPARGTRRLEGFSSLLIDLEGASEAHGRVVTFRSLGVDPGLAITLADGSQARTLGWALALAVALVGLAAKNRPVLTKVGFVVVVFILGTLVPLGPGMEQTAGPANMAVFAAALLVPYYLLAGCVSCFGALFRKTQRMWTSRSLTTAALLMLALVVPATGEAAPPAAGGPYVIEVVGPPEPVKVPDDAVILPYDPDSEEGIEGADRMLVPYSKYVELWNLAYPDQKLDADPPPAPYATAGASYRTRLEGDEYLLIEGRLEIDVYTSDHVTIPLGLDGGVLTMARLDGKPARLSLPEPGKITQEPNQAPNQAANTAPVQQQKQQARAQSGSFVLLHASGRGRHQLELAVRLRLERRGGWRVATGTLPFAPASALDIRVPRRATELRLGHVLDRQSYETERPNQRIETALGAGGAVSIQWRPKVAEGEVDRSLTAKSEAVLDVQEDGLRLAWQLTLEFPRAQRDRFSVRVPGEYLVEKVEGTNVRGWSVSPAGEDQVVEISLLNTARDSEQFSVQLSRHGAVGRGALGEFDVPAVSVDDAALQSGKLTIRRSPMLDLRSVTTSGVTRTDLDPQSAGNAGGSSGVAVDESPLGLRPYQAYRFVATPFTVRLAATEVAARVSATVHSLLKIAEYERSLESRVTLTVERRPIYQVRILLPDDLDLDDVSAPGEFQWALTRPNDRPMLTVYLAAGQQGQVPIVVRGTLTRRAPTDPTPLPGLEVLDVKSQQGDIAVQADPAFDVRASDLVDCQSVLIERIFGWLNPGQRKVARLAIHYRRPGYQGALSLSLRQPRVTCDTISNVRVTDRAVEETILLDLSVENAGIRELSFLLPWWMQDCRINVPMLRQKTIAPVGTEAESPLLVRLELQDEVMDKLRVLVENDRLLTTQEQTAPIPIVQTDGGRGTWTVGRQFVTVESAGRDEVIVNPPEGLQRVNRQQKEWRSLEGILGGNITQAYLVDPDAESPRFSFSLRERKALQMAGARIGLAQTNLVVDSSGAYRAEQIYRLDNTTEQYLEVRLPAGARLWTARVAGEPVKPTEVPGAADHRGVRVPLVKTAPGELDYAVVLKYGGRRRPLSEVGRMSFPLMRTVNVNVELSQVRLYLPETHSWFDFDGTMSSVGEEDDLTAGVVSYETKLAERLVKTFQYGSEFAQVRAANNLKQLALGMHSYHSTRGEYGNARLQEEYDRNADVLLDARQQLEKQEAQDQDGDGLDNRYRLNDLFEDQTTNRARNVVQGLGTNFSEPVMQPAPDTTIVDGSFNGIWLDSNKLSNLKSGKKSKDSIQRLAPVNGKPTLGKGIKAKPQPQAQFQAPVFQQKNGAAESRTRGIAIQSTDDDSWGTRKAPQHEDVLSRYKEEHLKQQQSQQRLQLGDSSRGGGLSMPQAPTQPQAGQEISIGGEMNQPGDRPTVVPNAAGLSFSADSKGVVAAPDAGTIQRWDVEADPAVGMASLDFELPLRGVVYRFSTPGGDTEITARAASSRMIESLTLMAGVLLALVVVLWIVSAARRGRFNRLFGRAGSIVLICLGLLLVFVLPVLGLAALISGIMILVRRAVNQQPAPA